MLHIVAASLALLEPPLVARVTRVEARTPPAPLAPADTLDRRALFSAAITAAIMPAAPALAESTLITRQQAYTRYVPRIERGRDFWAGGLRKYIANSDWAAITKEFEPVTKSKGGAIAKFFGPMRLWASSFSGKTVSDKTVAMNEAIAELEDAARNLEIAALGQEKDTGFMGVFGGKKKIDDASRVKLAQVAYKKGVVAFNKYIVIGNDGIGLNFAPIDTID